MNVDDDIKKAQEIIEKKDVIGSYAFSNYSRVYRGTNELISDKNYIKLLKNKKRVFTLTASGDQLLNSILLGSSDITCMDITKFAKYYAKLKIAAVKTLERLDYISFFASTNDEYLLSCKIYERVRKELDNESLLFWDSLFNCFNSLDINESSFFSEAIITEEMLRQNNPYLVFRNYNELRRKLDKVHITFKDGNVYSELEGNKEYDLINLSNIISYNFDKPKYKEFIENLPVRKNGVVLSYILGYHLSWEDNKEIQELFNDDNYNLSVIERDRGADCILVYKKRYKNERYY